MAFHSASKYDPSPRRTISWSISHQRRCQLDDHFIDRLDNTEVLGGEDSHGHHIGHTGCVNALSWSPSGQILASGSDDRNVVLWKLNSEHIHPVAESSTASRIRSSSSARYNVGASRSDRREQPSSITSSFTEDAQNTRTDLVEGSDALTDDSDIVQAWPQRNYPKMDLGMLGKIETGHRANIFSVKWAPNASERRLFTCAGDSHVRVFDINYMSSGSSHAGGAEGETRRLSSGREYNVWPEHSGACIRLFRCHRGRAKRISTEVSPDVFLTCGEDGDVRQMDLRVPHTCRSRTGGSCPPPLAHYPSVLYSLSVSKLEPWLFAVAGESPLAYLHDRRMIPRLIKREWAMSSSDNDGQRDALTMCVRSFGIPPGGFEAPWAQMDGRTALVSDAPPPTSRRLLMGNRNSITACKMSEHNGRDLLVSYSSGHIYRFDIYDEPGVLQANLENVRFSLEDEGRSQSAEEGASSGSRTEKPKTDDDADLEKGETNAHRAGNPVEMTGQDTNESDGSDTNNDNDDAIDEDDNDDNGDDDEEEDEDDEAEDDDDDEGSVSDEDLMHLLSEDSHQHLGFNPTHNVPTVYPRSVYKGHCNKETVKDVGFAGGTDAYVVSGSDDGNWFLWNKHTSEIRGIWHGDPSVVNVMAMHPDLPVFAISGIDDSIKIFAPITVTPFPAVEQGDSETAGSGKKREHTQADALQSIRAYKVADRLADKEVICRRNEQQLGRDLVTPAANILWRLHPRLLGLELDEDAERQIEGDCIVM